MKTTKHILLILLLSCSTIMMATEFQLYETSSATFNSATSRHEVGGGTEYTHRYVGSNVCPASTVTPMVNFHSTSVMTSSGSSLPSAANTGFISADDNLSDNTSGNTNFTPQGPQRVGGWGDNNPGDPDAIPLSDAVPCLLLLAIGYAIYLGRKTSVPNPDSRK